MIGRTLKTYRIEETLGRGGMGVVYGARDERLGRAVALKVLDPEAAGDPERRRRFLQEARAACAVTHPSIAQVYDVDEAEGVTFIAMERVEGSTVRDLVTRRELDALGSIEIAIQVAKGLARAHDAGIVHRDIKAENVMVTPDGHVKILDFGLAKLLDPAGATLDSLTRTKVGVVMGTVGSMSPEQARGQPLDHRSDLFSLGILLYEMVTGQRPFQGASPLDTLHAIAFEESRPVTTVRANLPASLAQVVSRALRKRPDDRYPDARAMVADLERVQREMESGISSAVPLAQRLRQGVLSLRELTPAEWVGPVALAVAIAAFLVLVGTRGGDAVPGVVLLAIGVLLVWRRLRNRRRRLLRRFASRLRKLPEVRLLVCQGSRAVVVVDRAVATTYVRVHALLDAVNSSMFFGDPFTVEVRESVGEQETRALLSSPGVIWVRPDVLEPPRPAS